MKSKSKEIIRKAKVADVKAIHKLINSYASDGTMLSRSLNILYETIRDFYICEKHSKLIGCVAIHIDWEDLAEIRSLAIDKEYIRTGIGTKLVKTCLKEAKELEIKKIFALTYKPQFFKKLGFKEVEKSTLPHKIWTDCINCPKFPECNETALIYEM